MQILAFLIASGPRKIILTTTSMLHSRNTAPLLALDIA